MVLFLPESLSPSMVAHKAIVAHYLTVLGLPAQLDIVLNSKAWLLRQALSPGQLWGLLVACPSGFEFFFFFTLIKLFLQLTLWPFLNLLMRVRIPTGVLIFLVSSGDYEGTPPKFLATERLRMLSACMGLAAQTPLLCCHLSARCFCQYI